MEEITKQILQFNNARDWNQFHSPENLAKSISIESGELLECFQWNSNFEIDDVKSELADILTYCVLLANKIGVDPIEIMRDKLIVSKQKYPISQSKGKSDKYTKLTRS